MSDYKLVRRQGFFYLAPLIRVHCEFICNRLSLFLRHFRDPFQRNGR